MRYSPLCIGRARRYQVTNGTPMGRTLSSCAGSPAGLLLLASLTLLAACAGSGGAGRQTPTATPPATVTASATTAPTDTPTVPPLSATPAPTSTETTVP